MDARSATLSVLIPTTPFRMGGSMQAVVSELCRQAEGKDVEVITLLDNERISIGEKVNRLYELATGRFCSIVADDDMVTPDYVDSLLEAIKENPDADVIVFDCKYSINGKPKGVIREGVEHKEFTDRDKGIYLRKPSDKMCWRRAFKLERPHVDTWETSDLKFARMAWRDVARQVRIPKALYHHMLDASNPKGTSYRRSLDRKYGKGRT